VINNIYLFPQFSKSLHRIQKNFEGKLVGADRTKDLAVLKVRLFILQEFDDQACMITIVIPENKQNITDSNHI